MTMFTWLATDVYSFIVESTLESLVILGVVLLAFKVLGIADPRVKARFLLLPLFIPVAVGLTFHAFQGGIRSSIEVPKLAEDVIESLPLLLGGHSESLLLVPFITLALFGFHLVQQILCRAKTRFQSAIPVSAERRCATLLRQIAERAGARTPKLVLLPGNSWRAYTIGYLHPVVVISSSFVNSLDDQQLEAVLAHEVAHARRGDALLDLLAKAARAVMFFNPVAHVAYAAYAQAKEQAADDLSLKYTENPLALADSLLKVWRARQKMVILGGNALFPSFDRLDTRISRLLQENVTTKGVLGDFSLEFYGLAVVMTAVFAFMW